MARAPVYLDMLISRMVSHGKLDFRSDMHIIVTNIKISEADEDKIEKFNTVSHRRSLMQAAIGPDTPKTTLVQKTSTKSNA